MEDSHGTWPWTIALVARHSATDHHFACDFYAPLEPLIAAGPHFEVAFKRTSWSHGAEGNGRTVNIAPW